MNPTPSSREREAFYGAALVGLRALDSREPTSRRFGSDADARWEQFTGAKGALGAADRIDLLLRDAAVTWGAAFSPAEAFGLFGLADDEPFGPDWAPLPDERARRLLAESEGPPELAQAARALGIQPLPVPLPPLVPATRLIAAGGSAVLALAARFAAAPELSWSDQVVVVASSGAHRQLAALAAVALNARGRTVLLRPAEQVATTLQAAGFAQVDAAVVSSDAEADAARFAQRATGGR